MNPSSDHHTVVRSYFRAGLLILALFLAFAASPLVQAQPATATTPDPLGIPATAPVTIDGKTLFRLRGVSAYPAAQRAADVRSRIIEFAKDESIDVGALAIKDEDDRSAIYAGENPIMSVLAVDAQVESLERALLAHVYMEKIAATVTEYRQDRSPGSLLENSLYALGITGLMVLVWWGLRALFRWLDRWTNRHVRKGVQDLASKSHQLIKAGSIWKMVRGLIRFVRALIFLVLTYVYLNTILGLYPWTRPAAKVLFRLILDPLQSIWQGFLGALPNLAFLVVLWFIVRYLIKLVQAFFRGVELGSIKLETFEPEWAIPTFKIVRIAMIAFALVIAYPYIPGSDSAAFKGVSVFLGVLLSLGSSSFIANMIAGLSMTYRGAFKEGDRIKVGDVIGTVEEVKLMVTRVVTPKNERVILPNSNVLNTEVINYSQMAAEKGVVLHSTVGIGYDTPWRQVEAMLLEAAARTGDLKKDPPPFVLQQSLGDFAVNYEINAYCGDATRMPATYSALHANIQDVFNENGVQIMSPSYEADPATPKIVPPEKWFEAPAKKPE
jgi:small-conductance mechanosensitive channel